MLQLPSMLHSLFPISASYSSSPPPIPPPPVPSRVEFARLHTIIPSSFLANFARGIGRHIQPGQKQADFGTLLEAAAAYIGNLQVGERERD